MVAIRKIIDDKRSLYWISADDTVRQAVRAMVDYNVGALPVLDNGRLVGVFSERDLMRRVIIEQLDMDAVKVSEVMSTKLVTANIDDDHKACLTTMSAANCRHLPIIDGTNLVAFLSSRDLLKVDAEGKDTEIQELKEMIYYVPPKASS
ncbi:MAG: CBS domain-containing protein [candidate division Zixibacteria bacterium]|nr:CBS domain-containing protein [candidate division Zixibacteria bacterium]